MKRIDLLSTIHDFRKTNLVTKFSNDLGSYDEYKCTKCGLKGRRYGLSEYLTVTDSYSDSKINNCTGEIKKDEYVGRLIKVIRCNAAGGSFLNMTPNSIHRIISPPEGYVNGDRGVWVQGIEEPVKLLYNEFDFLKFRRGN